MSSYIPIISNKFSAPVPTPGFNASSSPKTAKQWKAALKEVKLLYIQRQYKQCAARSTELLKSDSGPLVYQINPVYETYLCFYNAICNESLGRAAHDFSKNKLPLLHCALDSYVACNAVLPSIIPIPGSVDDPNPSPVSLGGFSSVSDTSEASSTEDSILSSITRIIDSSIELPDDDDPFVSDNEGGNTTLAFKLPLDDTEKAHLMPSPLQIRKPSSEFSSVAPSLIETEQTRTVVAGGSKPTRARRPPPLPIKIVPATETKAHTPQPSATNSKEFSSMMPRTDVPISRPGQIEHVTASPARLQSIMRYNSSIRLLRSQIGSSIADINSLIDEVTEIQHTRRISKTIRRSGSFWSFSPIKDPTHRENNSPRNAVGSGRVGPKETKEHRIARLRAEGWNTVGLKSRVRGWKGSEYYKAYCSAVLEELYLDV
ncbi:hypothetical protein PHISCL_05195 [Aspergillus sclerotialis]|uniref:Uncharacterized protein n=1 Tax=Aspergillus sclerotialis TaxID=2070753 RepID=A0A3A2ZJJ0_9EURO|nr:hypothetical protein PHISCL_05195 [Aspergillus sclerotialis]